MKNPQIPTVGTCVQTSCREMWSMRKSISLTWLGLNMFWTNATHLLVLGEWKQRARKMPPAPACSWAVVLGQADKCISKGMMAPVSFWFEGQPGPTRKTKGEGRGEARARMSGNPSQDGVLECTGTLTVWPTGEAKYWSRFWQIWSKSSSWGRGASSRGGSEKLHLHPNGPLEAAPRRLDLMALKGNFSVYHRRRILQQITLTEVQLSLPE